jgi:hypothetical protein
VRYKSEVARYGAAKLIDDGLVSMANHVITQTQVTLFECQLARSLKKTKELSPESCNKYCLLYASVSEVDVQPMLLEHGKKEAQKHST